MSARPRVSVVIPAHQAAATIVATLDSVAAQTVPAHEVIVCDDGSTDDGADKAAAHALRPIVIRKQRGGPASARNAAIARATGDLIAFLDADDLWLPEKLEVQLDDVAKHPDAGLFFAHAAFFKEVDGKRTVWGDVPRRRRTTLRRFLMTNEAPNLTVLVPKRVVEAVGPLDEHPDLIGVEDWEYWLRILLSHSAVYTPRTLALYRVRSDGLMGLDWARHMVKGTAGLSRFLEGRPGLTWRLYGLPRPLFLRLRVLRHILLGLRRGSEVTWGQSFGALAHLATLRRS